MILLIAPPLATLGCRVAPALPGFMPDSPNLGTSAELNRNVVEVRSDIAEPRSHLVERNSGDIEFRRPKPIGRPARDLELRHPLTRCRRMRANKLKLAEFWLKAQCGAEDPAICVGLKLDTALNCRLGRDLASARPAGPPQLWNLQPPAGQSQAVT